MTMRYDRYESGPEVIYDEPPFRPTVMATLDEIFYAQQLRLRLRESYERKPVPPPSLWWVGVD